MCVECLLFCIYFVCVCVKDVFVCPTHYISVSGSRWCAFFGYSQGRRRRQSVCAICVLHLRAKSKCHSVWRQQRKYIGVCIRQGCPRADCHLKTRRHILFHTALRQKAFMYIWMDGFAIAIEVQYFSHTKLCDCLLVTVICVCLLFFVVSIQAIALERFHLLILQSYTDNDVLGRQQNDTHNLSVAVR